MNYFLWVLGCQYNEWDGARLRYFLDSLGLIETDAKEADVIIIVACAVRQTAVDRVLGKAKNWIPLRSKSYAGQASKKVLVTGCILDADKKKFADKKIKIFEPGDFKTLQKSLNLKSSLTKNYKLKTNHSHYVPIMTGCNNFCSYCAVPYTRGREKSRPMGEIIDDVKTIIKYRSSQKGENYSKNFSADKSASKNKKNEIMLLGQNVNSYKMQKSKIKNQNDNLKLKNSKKDFTELLEKLNDLEGDFQISFTSNHPKDMSEDIINAVATLPKVKREIHLPLQSGSDKVLQSMNRPYTVKQYLDIVKKIKKAGTIDITTDVIVGYPTETEQDFEKTVEIFKKVKFKQAYINKYSPRSGTAAHKLGDPIPWSEKHRRWRILNQLIKR